MTQLQIFLLGPPEVRWGSGLLTIQRRYPRALLFYLAARGGMVGRQELLTLFWEDETESTARQRLRETLSRLKSCLPDPDLLVVNQDLIGLDFERVYVDQIEYRNLLQQAVAAGGSLSLDQPLTGPAYGLLQTAIRLWRSPDYLAGSRFPSTLNLDHWLTQTIQKMEYQRSRILDRLADYALSNGEVETALLFSQLAAESDEMNEALHERVMRILMLSGKKNEAQKVYQQIRKLFQHELDPGTTARLEALLQPTPPPPVVLPVLTTYEWNLHPGLDAPFIGRQDALQALHQIWVTGGGVAIVGESGIGKTRLIKEFVTQVASQARVMQARCLPNESKLPLQPLIDLGRREILAEEWQQLPAEWGGHLVGLLPELASVRADFQRLYAAPLDRAQSLILESIRQLARIIASSQRLLAFVDDLQWADQSTLDSIAYLLERPPFHQTGGALLILAVRAEEMPSEVGNLLLSLQQSGRLIRIDLGRLEDHEILDLAQTVLGFLPTEPIVKNLAASSGGNPLFLLETLRQMKEQATGKGRFSFLPQASHQNIHALIKTRLDSTSELGRACLDAAALIGNEFQLDLVKKIVELSEQDLITVMKELERKILVEPTAVQTGSLSYRFTHEKFREVLLAEMNTRQVHTLHRKIARAIQDMPGGKAPTGAAILAEHYEAAGDLLEAFKHWVKAGEYAYRMLAFEDAGKIFGRAESLIPAVEQTISEDQIEDLYTAWNEMAFELDDSASLEAINNRLLKQARKRQNSILLGMAFIGLSKACFASSQFQDGLELSAQAIEALAAGGPPYLLAQAKLIQGSQFYMQNCWEEAGLAFQKVLEICQGTKDEILLRLEAKARCQYATVLNMTGWPALGYDQVTRALAGGLLAFQPYEQTSAHSIRAHACHLKGDYRTARAEIQRGLARSEEIQSFRVSGYLFGLQALVDMSMGNLGAAWTTAERTIELGKEISLPDVIATGFRLKGDLFAVVKAYDLASEQYQLGLDANQGGFWGIENLLRFGYMECQMGRTNSGIAMMEKAISLAATNSLLIPHLIGKISLATVYYLCEEHHRADRIARENHEECRRRSLSVWQATCESIIGAVQFTSGQLSEARKTFLQVLTQSRRFPNVWMELRVEAFLEKIESGLGVSGWDHHQKAADILSGIRLTLQPELHPLIYQAFQSFCQNDQAAF